MSPARSSGAGSDVASGDAIVVEVWADVVCPWCLIGLRRLDAAVAEHAARLGARPVEVIVRSFELEPRAPEANGGSVVAHLAQRMGLGEDDVRRMMGRVNEHAATVGVTIDFDRVRAVNSRRAHEVLRLAHERGRGRAAAARLAEGHFLEGRDLGDAGELVRLAAEAGLDADEVAAALAAGTWTEAVRTDEARAHELGITGVPTYVIGGEVALAGAQPVETLAAALAAAG